MRELLQLLAARFRKRNYYIIRHRNKTVPIPIDRILYFQSAGNYIEIHTRERKYLIRSTFKKLERELRDKGNFLRVHRSYVVHVEQITSFTRTLLSLDELEVPVGKSYVEEVHRYLTQRVEENPKFPWRIVKQR